LAASIEELAYGEAVRGLAEQSSVLEDLQSRAGTLLAASSLVTSFLGSRALNAGFDTWAVVAVVAFVLASLTVIGVLWPRHRWRFVISSSALLEIGVAEQSLVTVYRELALRREAMYDDNSERMNQLFLLFRLSCIFLILEVIAWIVDLV
jgi:hypothetical protein